MEEIKKIDTITDADKAVRGVTNLSTRPNQRSAYGIGGLSAADLKRHFDALATLIIDRWNDLAEKFGSSDGADYIGIKDGNGAVEPLSDFISRLRSNASEIKLKLDGDEEEKSIAAIINSIYEALADRISSSTNDDQTIASNVLVKGDIIGESSITANNVVTSNVEIEGKNISSGLNGDLVFDSAITADGDANIHGNVVADGNISGTNISATENMNVAGNLDVEGSFDVTGNVNLRNGSELSFADDDATDSSVPTRVQAGFVESPLGTFGVVETSEVVTGEVVTGEITAPEGKSLLLSSRDVLVAGHLGVDGNLDVSGNLNLKGTPISQNMETLLVKDNIIVTNSSGASFSTSGLVIRTDTGAYGILYDPFDSTVKIGLGTLSKATDDDGNTHFEFDFSVGEAVPLAARVGFYSTQEGALARWDSKKNAFVPDTTKYTTEADVKTAITEAMGNAADILNKINNGGLA